MCSEQPASSEPPPFPPTVEDQRKLYAEVNQLLNQRFLLTTGAITLFGVFSTVMVPRDLGNVRPEGIRLIFVGAACLLFFLLLLFIWNSWLENVLRWLTQYLIETSASVWSPTGRG